ncbi:hypothetical protein HOLleu_10632 [Holothuria leucospilota]|uniref:EamA domain-containing protein n=1 Tax=Holothuria leucospilota TaxID=206669 RepID=A0A9Q1HF03_HOLLE|nr:hypothetical protein HOLleu_10632 [Holothuria leucospilota]
MAAIFIRSSFLFIFVVSVSWKLSEEYDWLDILYNNAFGFFDVISLCCSAVAMLYTRISDVSSIMFNEPIPAAIMACIFFGESFDIIDGALAITNGIGLVLICKISMDNSEHPDESSLFGIILSFGSLLCGTVVAIIGRALAHRNKADPSLMLVMVAFNGVIWPSIYLSVTSSWSLPTKGHDLLISLLLGLVTAFSAYAFTKLLKTENALLATISLTLCIPLTFFYDVLFKRRIVVWQTALGACLTIGSTICLYVKNYQFT